MRPETLCASAEELLASDVHEAAWQRTVSLLARQALEEAVGRALEQRRDGASRAPLSAQMLCLPVLIEETELGRRGFLVWNELSRACHFHGYELQPTIEDLRRWVACVREVVERLDAIDQ